MKYQFSSVTLYLLALFCLVICSSQTRAQQDEHFTQYMFNKHLFNPAFAGQYNHIRSVTFYRSQWLQFEGAPVTESISIDGPIKKLNIGVGLHILNDKAGAISKTGMITSYSYTIKFPESKLAFGLQGGTMQARVDGNILTTDEPDDQAVPETNTSIWIPDASFGMMYQFRTLYIGLSSTHLIESKIQLTDINRDLMGNLSRHFYLTMGYEKAFGSTFSLFPYLLIKKTQASPTVIDISLNALIENVFWTGIAYRYDDALSILLGYRYKERLKIGYAFDFTLTHLGGYNKGSHEIMLGYHFMRINLPGMCVSPKDDIPALED